MDSKSYLNISAETEFLRIVEGMVKYTQPMCPEGGDRVLLCVAADVTESDGATPCIVSWSGDEERLGALLMHICDIEPAFYGLLKRVTVAFEILKSSESEQES